jgi:acetate kinase
MEKENLTPQEAYKLMNKESGMLGVSGISYDMRDIEDAKAKGDERATVALDMYNYKVKKYIGAYAAAMNGVDVIVLTGGIGENADTTREGVCTGLEYLGVQFDYDKNKGVREKDIIISKENSKVKVMAVTTNEELVIARDTKAIVSNK